MEKIVNMIIEAYTQVMGADRWRSLTAEEQHAVIMTLAKETNEAITR